MLLRLLTVIALGASLGYVLQRGDMCFHSLWRRLSTKPAETSLFRAYLLMLLIATPIVQILIGTGYISPYIPPLVWQANLVGGLLFGVGMVIASTCITGMFYKLGHGMIGVAFAIAGWAVGDILTYNGPLAPVRDRLLEASVEIDGQPATLNGSTGGYVAAVLVAAAAARYLWNGRRESTARRRDNQLGWVPLGLALAAVHVVAWFAVTDAAPNYTFGTSGVPTTLWELARDSASGTGSNDRSENWWWIPIGLIAIAPGALIASRVAETFWFRGEAPARIIQLIVGGFVMGIAAAIASGCNLGHSMVGVPLLSLGSILTTAAMAVGVTVAAKAQSMFTSGSFVANDVGPDTAN